MKIADIPVGVDLYWARDKNYATPSHGGPGKPAQRLNDKRYRRTGPWSTGLPYVEDPKGSLVKIRRWSSGTGTGLTDYVSHTQIRGLYADIEPAVRAHCEARDAARQEKDSATKAERDAIAAAMRKIGEAVAPVAFISWEVTGGLGMALTRYENCVRMPRHSVEVILAHIQALEGTLDARDASIEELEGTIARLAAQRDALNVELDNTVSALRTVKADRAS